MAPEPDIDVIRLILPGEADLAPVVTVAVRVVARRLGIGEAQLEAAHHAAGTAFAELATGDHGGPIEVELHTAAGHLRTVLRAGTEERVVEAARS